MNFRVEELLLKFKDALLQLQTKLNKKDMALAANTMWCLWKAKNALLTEDKAFRPLNVIHQAMTILTP
jgi:hypothetical protein